MSGRRAFFYYENNIINKGCTARYKFSISLLKDKFVLDIGCGARMGPWIISDNAAKVFALDISKEAIFYCSKKWEKNNIVYLVADAEKLPFKNGIFDAVLSFELIEHLNDYKNYLAEVYRILKKGGMLIISTPNRSVSSPSGIISNPYHIREFDLEEFKNILLDQFVGVSLYGQKPSTRIIQAEFLLDIINEKQYRTPELLKHILPGLIKKKIRNIYAYIFGKIKRLATPNEVIEEDFIFEKNDIEKARNFLAICRK